MQQYHVRQDPVTRLAGVGNTTLFGQNETQEVRGGGRSVGGQAHWGTGPRGVEPVGRKLVGEELLVPRQPNAGSLDQSVGFLGGGRSLDGGGVRVMQNIQTFDAAVKGGRDLRWLAYQHALCPVQESY